MSNPDVLRTEQINLRLSTEERERLEKLAANLAISEQSLLRMLLKKAWDEFEASAGQSPSAPKKPRK